MLRSSALKLSRVTRSFSTSIIRAAEGDTGGVRSGGVQSSDAFNKREAASEAKFIRDKERESLKKLREKLDANKKAIHELEQHINEVENQTNSSG